MNAQEIKKNLGKDVLIDNEDKGYILSYVAGWIDVMGDDKSITKCRAKQLSLVSPINPEQAPEEPEQAPEEPEQAPEEPEQAPEVVSMNAQGTFNVTCPICGNNWETEKSCNYRCPACKYLFLIRLYPDRDKYVIGLGETESGRDTMDIADDVAKKLRSLHLEHLYEKVAEELSHIESQFWFSKTMDKDWKKSGGSLVSFLSFRYHKLNPGMQRMSIGNLLRGAIKREKSNQEA